MTHQNTDSPRTTGVISNTQKAFARCGAFSVPESLESRVLARVFDTRRKAARIRLWLGALVSALAGASLAPAGYLISNQLAASGFTRYVSLAFSDTGTLLSSWKQLLLALAESLPATGLIAVFAALFVMLFALRFALRNSREARRTQIAFKY